MCGLPSRAVPASVLCFVTILVVRPVLEYVIRLFDRRCDAFSFSRGYCFVPANDDAVSHT